MASLTKIMTAHVVLELLSKFNLDWDTVMIKVLTSSTTPHLGGTTAKLLPGDKLSVHELMYAMMLPSGNDAAQTLAIYFGNLCILNERKGASGGKVNRYGLTTDANINESDYPEEETQSDDEELSNSSQTEEREGSDAEVS